MRSHNNDTWNSESKQRWPKVSWQNWYTRGSWQTRKL